MIGLALALALALACSDKSDDTAVGGDGAATDGGGADGAATDGGASDGGTTDGGTSDGGTGDGGTGDGGASDGGTTVDWETWCTRADAPVGDLTVWPEQGLGPYYPGDLPERTELNVAGFEGQELIVDGRIVGLDGEPKPGVTVDLWAANPDGWYDTESGDYSGMGRTTADKAGTFCFFTLRPPNYTDGMGGFNAQHVHFAVITGGEVRAGPHLHFEGDVELLDDPQPAQTVIAVEELDHGLERVSFDIVVNW